MSDGSVSSHPICIIHQLLLTHQSVVSYWAFEIATKIMYYVLSYYVNKNSTSYSITISYHLLHFKDSYHIVIPYYAKTIKDNLQNTERHSEFEANLWYCWPQQALLFFRWRVQKHDCRLEKSGLFVKLKINY